MAAMRSSPAPPWCSARKRRMARRACAFLRGELGPAPRRRVKMDELPRLSVRLSGGIDPSLRRARPGRRVERLLLALVRRESVRSRRAAAAAACAAATAPHRHRHRRVQSVQPAPHPDRHGDRRARRAGAGPRAARDRLRHRLGHRAHGLAPGASARRRARRHHHRARAARGRGSQLRRAGVLGERGQARIRGHAGPTCRSTWRRAASRRWRSPARSPTG